MKLGRILLVQPAAPPNATLGGAFSSLRERFPFLTVKSGFAPVSLATIAALTPPEIEIDLWDEYVSGEIHASVAEEGYDLLGLTGFDLHLPRAIEIANIFHKREIPCIIGGPGVSSEPRTYRGFFDHIFIGEAELTWPQFVHDFQAGRSRPEYRQVEKPELADVPIPRWNLVPNLAKDYGFVPVQTTRGCPFDCEFCDVIYLFGRKPRNKPIENVLEELIELERMGVRRIFVSDDNFIGRISYAKELLRRLIPINNSFRRPLTFVTQLTLNVAKDEELLELLADANFRRVVIGIESANPENLREAKKPQNYKTDMLRDIHKIHSYGIDIHGQMVVGFDGDGPEVFDNTYNFIMESAIPWIGISVLRAYPGTRLWTRLRKERRVLDHQTSQADSVVYGSNITYRKMSRGELFQGYIDLYKRIYSYESVGKRIEDLIHQFKRKPRISEARYVALWEERGQILQLIKFMLLTRDREVWRFFLTSIRAARKHAPHMVELVLRLTISTVMTREIVAQIARRFEAFIVYEKNNPPKILRDDDWATLPDSFRQDYKRLFPSVYRRLSARLNDRSRLSDALVEVFTDFIERFRKEYDQLGEQRFAYLQETCDRTISSLNQEDPTTSPLVEAPPIKLSDRINDEEERAQIDNIAAEIRRLKLDNEILKAVEQEFRFEGGRGKVRQARLAKG